MISGATMAHTDGGIVVSVPLTMKKRNGRKEIIIPGMSSSETILPANHQEALVIALARAHRWKKLLDEGKFESITELAEAVGLDVSFAARLLRLTLLAPDIVEAILMGKEPNGLSLTKLTQVRSAIWEEQRRELGFCAAPLGTA